jgi:YD repeat-containing protein
MLKKTLGTFTLIGCGLRSDSEGESSDADDDGPSALWLSRKGYDSGLHTNPVFRDNTNAGSMPDARKAGRDQSGRDVYDFNSTGMGAGKVSFSDLSFVVGEGLPGEVSAEQCDLALPCPAGPQLAWVRSYRSKAPVNSGHGPGWDFSYNIYIEPVPLAAGVNAPVVIVHDGSGRSDRYVRQADGSYRCNGMFRVGRFNPDTSFTLTFADKGSWIFCPLVGAPWAGRIGSITDRNGVALSFTYNAGQLATVSDAFGRSLSVTWGPTGQISSVADSTGRSVSYSYYSGEPGGTAGDLKDVSCPQVAGQSPVSGPTTFTYTSGFMDDRLNHNLASATDGAGRNLGAFTYSLELNPVEFEFDAVASIRKGHELPGNVTLIKIGPAPQPPGSFDPTAAYVVYECDELGRVSETTCDRMHRPTMVRDYTGFAIPGVPVTATTNRPTGKLRASDPDFFQTTCLYNGQHLPTRVTHADGMQERTTYEYDLNSACPLRERANPRVCTLVSSTGEQRTVTMQHLPGFGSPEPELVRESPTGGPGPRKGTIGTSPTKPHGPRESPSRRAMGGGDITYIGPCDASEASGISLNGLPPGQPVMRRAMKTALASTMRMGAEGGIWDGGDGEGGCTDYARGVDRDGKDCTNPGRPKLGAAKIGPKQKAWLCSNFRINLRTSLGQQFTWTYDAAGNCTSSRTPIAGAGCDVTYNALGQVTTMTTLNGPGSSFTDECVYDPVSRFCTSIIEDSPGLHLTTSYTRDALGRVTGIIDPRGFDTLFTYNPLDQCVTVQSPPVGSSTPARITTTYFYDAGGLPSGCDVEHRDTTGALVAANPAYSVRYLRESPSRPRRVSRLAVENRPVSLPPGSTDLAAVGLENFDVSDFLFDAAGQVVQESTPAVCRAQPTDSVTSYQYDERGLLNRCIDGQAGLPGSVTTTTECDYTPAGLLSRCATIAAAGGLPGAENPTVTFTYDGFRRCTSSTDPMGNLETFVYDNQGNVTCSLYGENDDQPGQGANVLLSTYRIKVWQLMQGQNPAQAMRGGGGPHFRWTPVVPKPRDPITYRATSAFFDVFVEDDVTTVDRFTSTSSAQEITTVNRSPAGLVMSVSTNGDTLVANTYDTAGRLLTCANGACSVAYTLDASGNVLSCTRTDLPSGGGNPAVNLVRVATYDALDRVVQISERANVSTFQYDSLSRETCFQPPVGAPVYSNYDSTNATGPYSVETQCDVDGDGSPETLGSFYARSCPKRYKIKIHIGGPPRPPIFGRSVTNSNGHTTTFTLDSQDRCVRTDYADGTQKFYEFDSLGRRVSESLQNGATFIREHNLNGALTNLYTGPCRPPYLCLDFVAVPPTSFHYNGRGDCTRLTQGTSDIIRTFDSCGNMISESQNGHVVQHSYTHRGRASTTYPGGARYNESRNAQGLLVSIAAEGAAGTPIASIQYLGYRPSQETRANGVVTTYGYRAINDPPLPNTGPDASVDACVQSLVTGPTGTVLSRSSSLAMQISS